MRTPLSPEARIFRSNKWIYSIGGVGRDLAYSLYTYFLLTFVLYTKNVNNTELGVISVIIIICRIWDGINDPIMGGIIEKTRSRFGKFKPWILIGAITNAAVLILIFTIPQTGMAYVIRFAFLYLLWDITYTMNDIGYWSMLPSLTSDPHERNSITSVSNLFAGLGTILANGLIPVFTVGAYAVNNSAVTGYRVVAVVIAIIFVVCQAFTCAGVKEKKVTLAPDENVGFKKMIKVLLSNKQVLWITVVMLFVNLSGSLLTAFGTNYIYLSYGYEGTYTTIFVIFYGTASGLTYIIYPMLSKKFRRMQLVKLSFIMTIAGYAAFMLSGTFASSQTISFACLCAESLFIGIGFSMFYLISAICLQNTIEYNELMTGSRDEALIFSLRPFMAKMSGSLQQLIIYIAYLAIGLTGITNGISDIENQAQQNSAAWTQESKSAAIAAVLSGAEGYMTVALRVIMAVLPVVFMLIGYLVMKKKFKIDENEYQNILTQLNERKSHEQ